MTEKKDPELELSENDSTDLMNRIMEAVENEKQRAIKEMPEIYQHYADFLVNTGSGRMVIPFVETIGLIASVMWLDKYLHMPAEYHIQ